MAQDGEKLLATVQHIGKTLGRTATMAEDILKVFSNSDGRLSLDKLYTAADAAGGGHGEHSMPASLPMPMPPSPWLPSAAVAMLPVTSLDPQISQAVTMQTPRHRAGAGRDPDQPRLLDRAEELLSLCMARLEDEFRANIERPDDEPSKIVYYLKTSRTRFHGSVTIGRQTLASSIAECTFTEMIGLDSTILFYDLHEHSGLSGSYIHKVKDVK